MKKRNLYLITIMYLLSLVSCEKPDSDMVDLNPVETFEESDAPVEYVHDNLSFQSPWGYKKEDNASRHYPLLVSGMWGEGQCH